MAVEAKLIGIEAVLKKMRALPPELQKKGLRTGLRKGANVVRKAAQQNAQGIDDPATAENIGKNIAVQFASRESRKVGGLVMRVGVRGGARSYANTRFNQRKQRAGKSYKTEGSKGNPGGDTFHWRFVEFGTAKMRARPFLRPALANNIERVTNTVIAEVDKSIDRIAKRGK